MVDTTAREIVLGDQKFMLPMLPPRANRKVYPLCVKLDPMVSRCVKAKSFQPTEPEYADILDVLGFALTFADPKLDIQDFENLVVKPQTHFDALLIVRLQTGAWVMPEDDGELTPGEAKGEAAAAP